MTGIARDDMVRQSTAFAAKTEIFGTAGNDILEGDAGDNIVWGLGGNDILRGNGGLDTLIGGTGDDLYRVSLTTDELIEKPGEGYDGIHSFASALTLPDNVEWAKIFVSGGTLTGNSLANTLIGMGGSFNGNTLYGLGGDDVLQYANAMYGGTGDDSYYINDNNQKAYELSGAGYDTVYLTFNSYYLPANTANIEKFVLAYVGDSIFVGNAFDSLIIGNDYANVIDGGGGADTMIGGKGQDSYYIDNPGDVVIEYADEGIDTVYSTLSHTLVNTERLNLTGTDNINGYGNNSDNQIYGNSGTNALYGYEGNDYLYGGAGADLMVGGIGNDYYWVDQVGDVVVENAGEGIDGVQSFINYTLGDNFENLVLAFDGYIGTGNSLDNVLAGNMSKGSTLYGLAGNDTLDGSNIVVDTLVGGVGNDIYYIGNSDDEVIELFGEGNDTVHSIRANVSIAGTYVENIRLDGIRHINGTGNELDNSLYGNEGNNVLIGAGGSDYIEGGKGNDILYGGTGSNILIGGLGDDTYHVSSRTDTLIERAGEGYDRVSASVDHVLQANFEELTLFGTANLKGVGNSEANRLTGNSGDNALYGGGGDDILTGGAGSNLLVGGTGNDTYYVTSATDTLYEAAGEGFDRVVSTVDHALQSNFEYLKLIGAANIKGVGNAQANQIIGNDGDNALYGGAGNDILKGGAGSNLLVGGTGDDDYYVTSATDRLVEARGEGYDRVFSTVDHVLQGSFEDLTLTGTANVNGWGNSLDNVIQGNGGNNRLYGGDGADRIRDGLGSDVVQGGRGADLYLMAGAGDGSDRFVFNSVEEADGDRFGDVSTGEGYFRSGQGDIIDLSAIDASTLSAGNDAFIFRGYADFSGQAGELILKSDGPTSPSYSIMGDVDGDGVADFTITIAGTGSLTAGDFIL